MATLENYLLKKGMANSSVASITKQVYQFINWCEEENLASEQVTYNDLLAYIKYNKRRGIKQITIQKQVGTLKHYFSWLINRKIREDNPAQNINVKGIQRKYLHHILKKQELETLYENYPKETPTQKRNKIIIGLLIYQGLNSSNLQRLTVKDVKLREGEIYIAGSRTSNERTLKLASVQILDLMEYTLQIRAELIKIASKETEQLILTTGRSNELRGMLPQLQKQINQQNNSITSLQQIRASIITGWLKNYNLREVQYMSGHKYVSSTESYLINDLDSLTEDVNKHYPI